MVSEDAGDTGEDARLVDNLQADVVTGHQLRRGLNGQLGGVTPGERTTTLDDSSGGVQNIRHDGGRGG